MLYQVLGQSEGGSVDEDFLQEAATSAGEEQVVLQRLEKWTQYRISVSASTAVGPGPESEPLICRTDEDGTVLFVFASRILSLHRWTVQQREILGLRSRTLPFAIRRPTFLPQQIGSTNLDLLFP